MSDEAGKTPTPSIETTSTDSSKSGGPSSDTGIAAPSSEQAGIESDSEWFADLGSDDSPKDPPKETPKSVEPPAKEDTKTPPKSDADQDQGKDGETPPSPDPDPKVTDLEKRLKDTRDAFTQERQRNMEQGGRIDQLSKQLETLSAKLDGTYKDPEPPSSDEVAARASMEARVAASNYAAVELFMVRDGMSKADAEKAVIDTVWNSDGPYMALEKSDPAIKARVMSSHAPVLEALKVVKEHELQSKYGTDPNGIRTAIRNEVESEMKATLTKQIRDEIIKELRGNDKSESFQGVPRSGSGKADPKAGDLGDSSDADFSALFNENFASNH